MAIEVIKITNTAFSTSKKPWPGAETEPVPHPCCYCYMVDLV